MKFSMVSRQYDGLKVTLEGEPATIANWIHENVRAGDAALSAGQIVDQRGDTIWQHYDLDTVAAIKAAVERGKVTAYNVQDATLEDDCFIVECSLNTDAMRLFVTNAISRAQIAEDLNGFLEDNECLTSDRLKSDDVRLTDEICTSYAGDLGEVNFEDMSEEMVDLSLIEIYEKHLKLLGISTDVSEG